MESERWATLWVGADSKKWQICVVQMANINNFVPA